MNTTEAIKAHLLSESISFEEIEYSKFCDLHSAAKELGIPPEQIVRSVLFENSIMRIQTVVPISHILDIEQLQDNLDSAILPVYKTSEELDILTSLAFGKLNNTQVVIDKNLELLDEIYFPLDSGHKLLKIGINDFKKLQTEFSFSDFAISLSEIAKQDFSDGLNFKKKRIIERLEDIVGLPAMPEMGYRILQTSRDPNSDAKDLSKVIELDPSLSAQIMSYSTSAFYGYQGEIVSVREAISRVLGFELVANLALGIAVGKSFNITPEGPLGLSRFWRHAVYSSVLAEKLAKMLPKSSGLNPGLAYLCGLLHNFGHLLIGHVFSPGFELLNHSVCANPDIDIKILEQFNLGMCHDEIGANLLEKWKMPTETIHAARWHHDETYNDESSNYVNLIQLVDRLMKRHDIGDAESGLIPDQILEVFGSDENQILAIVDPLLDTCTELDNLAKQIAD